MPFGTIAGNVSTRSGDYVSVSGTVITSMSGNIVQISGQVTKISGQQVVVVGDHAILEQDIVTNSIVQLGHPHDDIHEGNDYFVSDIARDLASGTFMQYLVITSTKISHMLINSNITAGSIIRWIESPTVSSNGLAMTTINRNRISGLTTVTTIFRSGIIASGTGTILQIEQIGSIGGGPNQIAARFGGASSEDRNENEWNLKMSGTIYMLEIFTLTSGQNDLSTQFRWYDQ